MTKLVIKGHSIRDNEVTLFKSIIEKWIKENYYCIGLKISNNLNKDGLYEVTACDIEVKNENITSLTNGMFEWKKVNNSFNCSRCKNLLSLEGAPQEVGEDFFCTFCTSLKSLVGAPKKVGGEFYCYNCKSLKTLEGAPKEVEGNFDCSDCKTKFTVDDVRKVSDVKGGIYC